ncbi:MAG: hypothetical protein ABL921_15395 [Pirellula sp.]
MADDLEDFLKQAAQRRAQKQQNKANRPPVAKPSPTPSVLRPTPPSLSTSIPTAEVVENTPYKPSIGSLTQSLPAGQVSQNVDDADERMASHLSNVFEHEISHLRAASNKTQAKRPQDRPATLSESPSKPPETKSTVNSSNASLIKQLRDPQSLRMSIIAHEILKRPWQ